MNHDLYEISERLVSDDKLGTAKHRLEQLIAQLRNVGPEHFNQGWWLDEGEGINGRYDLCVDVASSVLIDFDINACGATACLAGHGALVMAHAGVMSSINSHDVAEYFYLPRGWFDATLMDHPFSEIAGEMAEADMPSNLYEWLLQLLAVTQYLECINIRIEELDQADDEITCAQCSMSATEDRLDLGSDDDGNPWLMCPVCGTAMQEA